MTIETPYNTTRWRDLPRSGSCEVGVLLGTECDDGPLHRHHVQPLSAGGEAFGRTVLVCKTHHPSLEALARRAWHQPEWKTCPHVHRTKEGREACERRLNRALAA